MLGEAGGLLCGEAWVLLGLVGCDGFLALGGLLDELRVMVVLRLLAKLCLVEAVACSWLCCGLLLVAVRNVDAWLCVGLRMGSEMGGL